jgi:signal transduction histidine kinase
MAVMIGLVYAIVDHGFKSNLLRACDDDLRAIREAYNTADPRSRAVHEATEIIEDRTLASDAQVQLLLEVAPRRKLAGNMQAMPPRLGVVHLRYPAARGGAARREVLGRGVFIAPHVYALAARDLSEVNTSEREIVTAFAGVLLASIVLAAVTGLWLSGRYLRQIDAISETCRAIMAGAIRQRVSTRGAGGELERLAATVNAMLDRIQDLMGNLRQVTDDIAHDLRTPLTHLRSGLEQALSMRTSPVEYERTLRQAITEADHLLEIFAALLRIARIETGARRESFRRFDLGEVLTRAVSMYRPLMEDAAYPFSASTEPGVLIHGDSQLVLQLATNLLDNAIHHTPPGTCVAGWVGLHDGCPTLVISDTGPGVPEDDRERVLRRFVRLDKSRSSDGHGLGLAMAAAIVELHDGRITLSDNRPGLRVQVQFPPVGEDRARSREDLAPISAEA